MGAKTFSSTYYHAHNYVHFIYLVKKAFATAFQNLKTAAPTKDGIGICSTAVAPYLVFDPRTNRSILNAQQFFFDDVANTLTGVPNVEIYFNERLYDLFVGLPYEYVSIPWRVELQTEGHAQTRTTLFLKMF